jgi:hypothetical protein
VQVTADCHGAALRSFTRSPDEHISEHNGAEHQRKIRRSLAVARATRTSEAVRLRHVGLSYREIAERLKWRSPASAFQAVRSVLESAPQEAHREMSLLEAERLDALQAAFWSLAVDQRNVRAGRLILDIVRLRVHLFGLDRGLSDPVVDRAALDAEVTALLEEVAGLEGARPSPGNDDRSVS